MKTLTAEQLAEMLKAKLSGNRTAEITGVASLEEATEGTLTFYGDKKFYNKFLATKASIVIVHADFNEEAPEGKTFLKCESPNIAFSKVVDVFAPPAIKYSPGIHPTAIVSDSAEIGENCHIGPYVVIGDKTVIGRNTTLLPGVVVGPEATIGDNCLFYSSVIIREYCKIGNNVVIHPNVTIGADGFGFTPTPFGITKIPQVGIVVIEDDVEIGANSTVDRARFGKTWIKTGVKIDNLVTVGHNCTIGEFSILCGQCGIAGSAKLGQGVLVASKAAINNHITVGDGAVVGPCAVVKDDVPSGAELLGYPAVSPREFLAQVKAPNSIKRLREKVRELEKELKNIKSSLS